MIIFNHISNNKHLISAAIFIDIKNDTCHLPSHGNISHGSNGTLNKQYQILRAYLKRYKTTFNNIHVIVEGTGELKILINIVFKYAHKLKNIYLRLTINIV